MNEQDYRPYEFPNDSEQPCICPRMGMIAHLVWNYRLFLNELSPTDCPDQSDAPSMFPEMDLDHESVFDPAARATYCGICKLLRPSWEPILPCAVDYPCPFGEEIPYDA